MSALLYDADVKEAAAAKDRERLQGVWNFITGRRKVQLYITGDHFTAKFSNGEVYVGTFEVDPTKKPKAMDMTVAEGPERYKGLTTRCIYALDGEHLVWCPGARAARPAAGLPAHRQPGISVRRVPEGKTLPRAARGFRGLKGPRTRGHEQRLLGRSGKGAIRGGGRRPVPLRPADRPAPRRQPGGRTPDRLPPAGAAPAAGDVPVPLRRPGRHEALAAGLPRDDGLPFAGRFLPAHLRGRRLDRRQLDRRPSARRAADAGPHHRPRRQRPQARRGGAGARAQPPPRPDGQPTRPHFRQGRAKSVSHRQRRHGPDARRPKPGAGPGQDRLRLPAARAGRKVPRRRADHPPIGQAAAQRRRVVDRRGRPEQMAADD